MMINPYSGSELVGDRQRELRDQARRARLGQRLAAAAPAAPRRRHRGMAVAAAAVAAGLALALTACGGGQGGTGTGGGGQGGTGPGLSGQQAGAGIVGTWNGPVPDPPGNCGKGAGTFYFGPDGSYTFSGRFDPSTYCDGYESTGSYQVNGDVISFQPDNQSAFTDTYSLDGSSLQLCDSSGGPCYPYQKQ